MLYLTNGIRLFKVISCGKYYKNNTRIDEVFLTFSEIVPTFLRENNTFFFLNRLGNELAFEFFLLYP